mmetsp:Transcript_31140/g.71195  ORF Transcript_31140/g.71195 Transcript_31140/m.71195 type:complete len:190 (-) Transcript_31140:44-613(-)
MSPPICETIYYIAGWILNTMNKLSERRAAGFSQILTYVFNTCRISGDLAKNNNLPTGKTDRVIAFGGLPYPSVQYYEFILRIEDVFARSLTYEHLVVYGQSLVDEIRITILNFPSTERLITEFVPPNTSTKLISKLLEYLLAIYARIRGKDFAMKLLNKRNSLKVPVRQKLAVLSSKESYTDEKNHLIR